MLVGLVPTISPTQNIGVDVSRRIGSLTVLLLFASLQDL